MSAKDKLITDLKRANQNEMAAFILSNKQPEMEKLIEQAMEGKHYLVFCKTCGKVFVNMPFKDYYKAHTFPEWDIWFCDATLHWAETEGKHSIYCFSDEKNYDISGSNSSACHNESWAKIHRDMKAVVTMREKFMKNKNKNKLWVTSTAKCVPKVSNKEEEK
jgi:hypothetical protein